MRIAGVFGFPAAMLDRSGVAAWFNGRERRERMLILAGGAVVLAYLAYAGLYQPLTAMRAAALAEISTYETLTARVAASASNLAPATTDPEFDLPSATAITNSANAVGLVIRRLEPEGERTWIELEQADFTVLVEWLALLENQHSLKVATIELDRRPEPGVVAARISVEN